MENKKVKLIKKYLLYMRVSSKTKGPTNPELFEIMTYNFIFVFWEHYEHLCRYVYEFQSIEQRIIRKYFFFLN